MLSGTSQKTAEWSEWATGYYPVAPRDGRAISDVRKNKLILPLKTPKKLQNVTRLIKKECIFLPVTNSFFEDLQNKIDPVETT